MTIEYSKKVITKYKRHCVVTEQSYLSFNLIKYLLIIKKWCQNGCGIYCHYCNIMFLSNSIIIKIW